MYGSYTTAYPKKNLEEATAVIKHSEHAPELQSRGQLMEALKPNKIVVVSAWAPWCNPCKVACKKLDALITTPSDPRDPQSSRILDYIQNDYIQFFSDNIENEDSFHKSQVSVVPTFFIYYDKKLLDVLTNLEFDKMVVKIQQLLTQEYQRRQPLPPPLPPVHSQQQFQQPQQQQQQQQHPSDSVEYQ